MLAAEDYPVLDEEDYSEREYEAAMQAISEQVSYVVSRLDDVALPADVVSAVYRWLSENEHCELEHGGDGAYPSVESVERALVCLQYIGEHNE